MLLKTQESVTLTADVLEAGMVSVFSFVARWATWRFLRSAAAAPAPAETSPRPSGQAAVRAVAASALPDRERPSSSPARKVEPSPRRVSGNS